MEQSEQGNERWKCLFGSKYLYKAEILKSLLEENNIPAVIINKQDSAYLFGDIEVFVKLDDLLKANRILSTFMEDE